MFAIVRLCKLILPSHGGGQWFDPTTAHQLIVGAVFNPPMVNSRSNDRPYIPNSPQQFLYVARFPILSVLLMLNLDRIALNYEITAARLIVNYHGEQMMIAAQWLARLFAVAILLGLMACASAPKPTIVKASVDVKPTVNPDAKGRPSPIIVRVYALKSLAAFNGADFFSLFEKDKETLAAELLDREELQMMPGQKRDIQKQFPPETRYIGVIAAFRDLERSEWRASVVIPPQKTTIVQIELDGKKVSIANGK